MFCSIYTSNSQSICGKVVYKETSNISLFYQTILTTMFNEEASYAKYITGKEAKPYLKDIDESALNNINEDVVITLVETPNKDDEYVYATKKETFFSDTSWAKTLTIKENAFGWRWKLLGETKKIGKFTCQNASIRFRGRTFIAWFTTEIASSFGPWKFKGLPGLILEVYDSKKLWQIIAVKVDVSTKKKCKIPFDIKNLKNAMTINQYIVEDERLIIEDIKKYDSKRGQGSSSSFIPECMGCSVEGKNLEIFGRKRILKIAKARAKKNKSKL